MHASEDGCWDLTAGQLEIWQAQQLSPDSSLYNVAEYLEISGRIDIELFEAALRITIREAEAMRIRLRGNAGLPQQYVSESTDWELRVVDVSAAEDPHAAAKQWMQKDMRSPVDFHGGCLFSEALFKVGPDRFFWYHRAHHIAIDGFSGSIIAARQAEIYTSLLAGRSPG